MALSMLESLRPIRNEQFSVYGSHLSASNDETYTQQAKNMMEALLPDERPSSSYAEVVPMQDMSPRDLLNEEAVEPHPGFNRSRSLLLTEARKVPPMIDNSTLTYLPIYLASGVTVCCRPDVLTRCPQILRDLDLDVKHCLQVLPKSTHGLVRRTKIWVNTTYYYGPTSKPKNVNHSTAHHHQGWLLWARDRVDKATGIEIYNCFDYRRMRWHWNGCGLLLHELCHIIHQFCLGLENSVVEKAYLDARESGKYDSTLRRDWAGLEQGDKDFGYALINPKEFFAELSVAFWSQGYQELTDKDPENMSESSPPFIAPSVVARLDHSKYPIANESLFPKMRSWFKMKGLPPHCNKFYPFTRGQFQKLDPGLFGIFECLWKEIEDWHDEDCAQCSKKCWPC
jgi:hypothetical protein